MSRIAEYRPIAFSFPDSLNLFVGGWDLNSTVRIEGSTTLQEAYRPYSGRNYVPTAAARKVQDGTVGVSRVRTTKAVHIEARPKTQIGISPHRMERITSYSYQFNGEKAENRSPFRPRSELAKPKGLLDLKSTQSGDYQKFQYGRPVLSYIPDTGLFEKATYSEGTTHSSHYGSPGYSKSNNLRPKTSVVLGKDQQTMSSVYRDQFDKVKEVYELDVGV